MSVLGVKVFLLWFKWSVPKCFALTGPGRVWIRVRIFMKFNPPPLFTPQKRVKVKVWGVLKCLLFLHVAEYVA